MPTLKKTTQWARNNPISARVIIAIATILSVFLHYYWGIYLFAYDILLPYSFAIGFIVLGITGAFFYPIKKHNKGIFAYTYRKQKSLDFLIFVCGGLLVMYLGNQRATKVFAETHVQLNMSQAEDIHHDTKLVHLAVSSPTGSAEKPSGTFSRKELRKQLKIQIKQVKKVIKAEIKHLKEQRKKGERGTGINVLLSILAVAVALGLGTLVAALACSLSCNGNELAGTVVLIIGWAGILTLLFFVIKKIFAQDSTRQPNPKNKDSKYPY